MLSIITMFHKESFKPLIMHMKAHEKKAATLRLKTPMKTKLQHAYVGVGECEDTKSAF